MSHWKSFGPGIFAAVCVLGGTASSVHAQCNTSGSDCATEWSGGGVIELGGLPAQRLARRSALTTPVRRSGYSAVGNDEVATEWSGGSVINLGGVTGYANSEADSINRAGQAAGVSYNAGGAEVATEWSGGSVINLGGLPGSTSSASYGIDDSGRVVESSVVSGVEYATEWSGSSIIDLGGLPGSTSNVRSRRQRHRAGGGSQRCGRRAIRYRVKRRRRRRYWVVGERRDNVASSLAGAGQAVGWSFNNGAFAAEWNGDTYINLGGLYGFTSSLRTLMPSVRL